MKNTIKFPFSNILVVFLLVLFIPYIITSTTPQHSSLPDISIPYDGRIVITENKNIKETFDYSVYLQGMVSRMMISFDDSAMQYDELIKLCCLISNTLLTQKFQSENVILDEFLGEYYIDEDDLKTYWGDKYTEFQSKIASCINITANQIITCNNMPIIPLYHLVSSGMTRPSSDNIAYPYIKSVNTNKDLEENAFLAVKRLTKEDFIKTYNNFYPDTNINIQSDLKEKIQISGRDNAGYVTSINVGETAISGDEFAKIFLLNSPAFTIIYQEDSIKIITKGIGHGYGISLAFALRKAMEGETYDNIIKYFYENVEISSI